MIISALNEKDYDTRVAITPSVIKHYSKLGLTIYCEADAGAKAGFKNSDYEQAGAAIFTDRSAMLQQTDILVCIGIPVPQTITALKKDALIIAPFDNEPHSALLQWCQQQGINAFSMNLIPRISRAQSMDSLSSQANLAGYRAVLEGVNHFNRAIPMMMTAAGMIKPAKILILGAGVAGLQAIATAKRLGAVVYAFDVRRATKEQVESLGAEFIEVASEDNNETSGGYAQEMSDEYKKRQGELIRDYAMLADIVVTTALIPGRPAPVLLPKTVVEQMQPGSIIVDLATSRGGNCEVSQCDQVISHGEITIIGYSNLAGLVAATASELYANNVLNLVRLLVANDGKMNFNPEDEIIKQATLCYQGKYLPFMQASTKETANA